MVNSGVFFKYTECSVTACSGSPNPASNPNGARSTVLVFSEELKRRTRIRFETLLLAPNHRRPRPSTAARYFNYKRTTADGRARTGRVPFNRRRPGNKYTLVLCARARVFIHLSFRIAKDHRHRHRGGRGFECDRAGRRGADNKNRRRATTTTTALCQHGNRLKTRRSINTSRPPRGTQSRRPTRRFVDTCFRSVVFFSVSSRPTPHPSYGSRKAGRK